MRTAIERLSRHGRMLQSHVESRHLLTAAILIVAFVTPFAILINDQARLSSYVTKKAEQSAQAPNGSPLIAR